MAITVAASALMLFGVAALSVDLGNGMARQRDVQSQADLAALAAAGSLPGAKTATDAAVVAAARYLNHNQPQSDGALCVATESCVTAAQLVNGLVVDGEVYFESATRVRVISPPARVQFGLANAIGFNNMDVRAEATAGIFTAGPPVMPVYAALSCSWGPQDVTAPASPPPSVVPNLAFPLHDNARFDLDAPGNPPSNPSPYSVSTTPIAPSGPLTIKGTNLDRVTAVGFFPDGGGNPKEILRQDFSAGTDDDNIVLTMPIAGVTDTEAIWWVRLYGPNAQNNAEDEWSPITYANGNLATVPLKVGNAALGCEATSTAGNFGTLRLPRSTNSSTWLDMNIALGLEDPLTLAIYPGAPSVEATCSKTDGLPTVYSEVDGNPTRLPRTNCTVTDPGLTGATVSAGLVTGPDASTPGRLQKPTRAGCGTDRDVVLNGGGPDKTFTINDEHLTCYFVDSAPAGTNVGHVSAAAYTHNGGKPVISSDIYQSPRFFWQPILKQKPAPGLSTWKIIDMRPAFLTDQPLDATKNDPDVQPENGVRIVNKKVDQIHVVFLNHRAIEQPDGGPMIDWLGGDLPKLVKLVD